MNEWMNDTARWRLYTDVMCDWLQAQVDVKVPKDLLVLLALEGRLAVLAPVAVLDSLVEMVLLEYLATLVPQDLLDKEVSTLRTFLNTLVMNINDRQTAVAMLRHTHI